MGATKVDKETRIADINSMQYCNDDCETETAKSCTTIDKKLCIFPFRDNTDEKRIFSKCTNFKSGRTSRYWCATKVKKSCKKVSKRKLYQVDPKSGKYTEREACDTNCPKGFF